MLLFFGLVVATAGAAEPGPWSTVADGVTVEAVRAEEWRIVSRRAAEFTLESAQSYPARPGDVFAIDVTFRTPVGTLALPELVCFDENGKEIPVPSSLGRWTRYMTSDWQDIRRVFPTQPGTAGVRARIRGTGRGAVGLRGFAFRPTQVDAYATGALVSPLHPFRRTGVVLESNHGLVNRSLVTAEDRDGDGRWALILQDLDELTAPKQTGEDWRTKFEDDPNQLYWSDGAVLKSDTISAARPPDRARALHFKMRVHSGPYIARIGDPGRAVAVSLDGTNWNRYEGGTEINLGELPMEDGMIEFWLDACFRDPVSVGPVYFDYVRLEPKLESPAVERLYAAARVKPPRATSGFVEERRVSLTLDRAAAGADRPWPVRCGLPIPRGESGSAEHVAVYDAAGRKVPGQARVMATWPDESVRWLHVDFVHAPGARPEYTLGYGTAVRAAEVVRPLTISRVDGGMEIDTGSIRFVVSDQRFGLIEKVRFASGEVAQAGLIASEIEETGGKVWRASDLPVEKLTVEQDGPLHAAILVATKLADSGRPASGFHHRARIHAYAGSPVVQVEYFVANTDSRIVEGVHRGSMAGHVPVKSFSLRIAPARTIQAADTEAGRAGSIGARGQKTEDLTLDRSGDAMKEGKGRAEGWIALGLEGGRSLRVGLAAFRAEFPKAFRWSPRELQIDLWAPEGGEFEWIEGVGKTHRLALLYDESPAANASLLAVGPLFALAAPEWYVESGAFGPIEVAAKSPLAAVERSLAAHMRAVMIDQVGLGFENYGDHNSTNSYVKGSFLWDNNEYDTPAACIVHFVRSGDRDALRIGLAGALHYLDVDTIHYSSRRADWARAQHVHSHAAFGGHTAQGPDFHHAGYVQGLIWYSYLTGEPSGIEGARGIADWIVRTPGLRTENMERALGHPLMTLNDTYEATGDERYLRAAAALVDQALKWEHPVTSGFRAPITEIPAFYSGSPASGGLLSAGLMKFNGWARQSEIDALLLRVAHWTLTDMWRKNGIMNKGGSRRATGSAFTVINHLRLMAWAHERTNDPLYITAPLKLVNIALGEPTRVFGSRSTGLVFNYLPWFLAHLARAGAPVPEPEIEFSVDRENVLLAPGTKTIVTLRLRNRGTTPVSDLRVSLSLRREFTVTPLRSPPERIAPDQEVEIPYEIVAPRDVNLTSESNRIAHGHGSVSYRRLDKAHLAHRAVQVRLEVPPERVSTSSPPGR